MLAGPTKFWARFFVPVIQYRATALIFGPQSIEIDRKTKYAVTHPEPIGVCGQM